MPDTSFDFLVCGSTPFAELLAGLLASAHGKRVCLVGDSWSPYRLPRRLDVSVMPATRPETWALLKQSGAETLKLLGSIGRGLYERVDPLFVAETPDSAAYLGHMRWVALGLGFAAERAVDHGLTAEGTICRIRDAAMLVRGRAAPAIEAWLEAAGVRHMPVQVTSIVSRRDGTATLTKNGETWEAAALVLADDEAILNRLPAADQQRVLTTGSCMSTITEPAKPQSAALLHYLDRDVVVHQRAMKGPVLALAHGDHHSALARVGASIATDQPLRRTGQAVFQELTTRDGAPLVGRMGRGRMNVVAGLGMSAAFLAPAVARLLAGTPSEEEARYFEARDPARAATRHAVAEMAGDKALEMQS